MAKFTSESPELSVIVTTYNWPSALSMVLNALAEQTYKNFEVIVADDGSTYETKDLISEKQKTFPVPLKHVWQEDLGFRASRCRNLAINASSGSYIIFLDGDCIPRPSFLENHISLRMPGTFVVGNRVLLSKQYTSKLLKAPLSIHRFTLLNWLLQKLKGNINRLLPLSFFPIPSFTRTNSWKGAKGCNIAVFKNDLELVNGWDESFVGWGYEDTDLVIRLLRRGLIRKDNKTKIPVLHLWHKENDRSNEPKNLIKLKELETSNKVVAKVGLKQNKLDKP